VRSDSKRLGWIACSVVMSALLLPAFGRAQEADASEPEGVTLGGYLDALASRRLIADETGSVERLRALVREGEEAYFEQRYDDASLILYEVVESPRFADFVDLEDFAGSEVLLAGALAELGSLRSAARYLQRTLSRGTEDPYFGPAYRRFVDVTLESGDLAGGLLQLEAAAEVEALPEDAKNELTYLRARVAYDGGQLDAAEALFEEITRRSRFFASAQYYRGVIAAKRGDLDDAEARFCSIATTEDQERYTFYVDDRFFRVKDLAWLGLGRVAHEGLRSEDAFYYYFQVPNDSERVDEALFEAAYAMYEGDDHDTAIDLLDQLEARAPASPFVDEAMLLRGYVHLGRCEFEEASQLFVRFQERFAPLVAAIDRILESETRQGQLYEELLAEEKRLARLRRDADLDEDDRTELERDSLSSLQGLLLALLRVDPTFYELHAQLRILDAEAARAGRLSADLRGLATRIRGEGPAPAAEREAYRSEVDELRSELMAAREMLEGLVSQVDSLRAGGAEAEQLAPIEEAIRDGARRAQELAQRLRQAERALEQEPTIEAEGDLEDLLRADARAARQLPSRVRQMRARLIEAAGDVAVRGLRDLRARLGGELRRARIGRIDAVMGSKRRIEIQIESLAAGRFPPELIDPLRVQGLLRDDEEYWPFEGEYWADEFDETVALDGGDEDEPADDDEGAEPEDAAAVEEEE